METSIKRLISEEQCYETIRQLRWSGKIGFRTVTVRTLSSKWGRHSQQPACYRYECKACVSFFEFVHNVKKRGKRLLFSLLETLLKKTSESI